VQRIFKVVAIGLCNFDAAPRYRQIYDRPAALDGLSARNHSNDDEYRLFARVFGVV
jgi:hypothetical protein